MQSTTAVDLEKMIAKKLDRVAWRYEYHAKKNSKNLPFNYDITCNDSFDNEVLNKLYINEILSKIPDKQAEIIRSLYLEDRSIKEVAMKKEITVQGANKWKRRALTQLKEEMMK